ncbi:MAG: GTPase Era [Pseudomonadota bacterium]
MSFKSGYVAIVGRPNVGKSTLLNAILGERLAIVTAKPQTTRHRITGIYNDEDSQIVFLDTPGYHKSNKPLNQVMLEIVDAVIRDADVICLMIDAASTDHEIEQSLFSRIGADRCIVVANKADQLERGKFDEIAGRFRDDWGVKEFMFLSALKGQGVGTLIQIFKEQLPDGEPFYPDDIYTSHAVRFIAAEIIREEVFLQMHEEIPYSAAVEIEEFKDPTPDNAITRIRAAVVVERESQKGMVIGKNGARIKEIGTNARKKIEELVDGKVFLDLRVRVEKDWTKDKNAIKRLGYSTQLDG